VVFNQYFIMKVSVKPRLQKDKGRFKNKIISTSYVTSVIHKLLQKKNIVQIYLMNESQCDTAIVHNCKRTHQQKEKL